MAPVFSIPENVQKLRDEWIIRGSIIVSFSVQASLLLLAPLRQRSRSWGTWFIWLLYLFADWVAISTIGLIVQRNSSTTDGPPSDIMAFWAPFLLLHLGGPDNITSYAVEDNKLWQRRLLELVLQFCFTIYIFLTSISRHELWIAPVLVLVAGMVKYVERIVAFYRASLDHFGENWQETTAICGLTIPAQFKYVKNNGEILQTAVLLLGSLRRIIIGPAPKKKEREKITDTFLRKKRRNSDDALKIIEIELSLLYELLHTKLPVIDSTIGFISRMATFSCILVALLSFSLVKKHYQLGLVDILLTYGLLIGALVLDFLSRRLLIKCSDWCAIARLQDQRELPSAFINRHRWCREVSQLNFFTYHVKDYPVWLKNLVKDCMRSLLENININFLSPYNREFRIPLWRFIWCELLKKYDWRAQTKEGKKKGKTGDGMGISISKKKAWLSKEEFICLVGKKYEDLMEEFIFKLHNFSEAILVWHIGTELCFQDDKDQYCRHESERNDNRSICKLLSDYMFFLAVGARPGTMTTVLDDWRKEFSEICDKTRLLVPWSFFLDEKTACKKIKEKEGRGSCLLEKAVRLNRCLKKQDDYQWELMSKVWVHLMFFAAVTCSRYVHLQQPSKGGELLTFIWLSLNHLGLGIKSKTLRELFKRPPMKDGDKKTAVKEKEEKDEEEGG